MSEQPATQFDPDRAARLLREAEAWTAMQKPRADPSGAFAKAKEELAAALATLPDKVVIPYEKTPEGERFAQFRRVCPEKFFVEVDFTLIRCRRAYDAVLGWDGSFPGPCCVGPSDIGKTFAAWQAIRRLYVDRNQTFAWFPVRRLVTELERFEARDCADDFFRTNDFHRLLFVDDLDKINWDFESHAQMLFSFLDWIYRAKKPCIVTTNRDRKWWKEKAGEALVRRLFVDACREVEFR